MYYAIERAQKICNDLKNCVYFNNLKINDYKIIEGNYLGIDEINSANGVWNDFHTGDLWGGRDTHCWVRTSVTVPNDFEGKVIALCFKTFDEGWDAINPQFILYVNGEHVQGIDINHKEIILSHNAKAGEKYEIDLHAYSGMVENRKATLHGELVIINSTVRDLYFNLQVPVWVCEKLNVEDKRRIDMLAVLNNAINNLDLRKIFSDDFFKSVDTTNEFLGKYFYEKLCGHEDTIASCVGHTHIDVAWQWTVAQTREKVGRSFSTVLRLMDEYPEYVFMSSQPQLYKFIKEDYPDVFNRIVEKVKEGVWEPEGAMWLEPDCNVTSGESLVRQILFGKRFFKQEFGVESEVLWLPDVFGYSAALPQILKKSDVKYFMTTKISWNQFNKMPFDTFMWEGIDGTELLTHFVTTKDPYQDPNSHFTTYNGQIHPGAIMGAWDRYQQKEINDDVLVSFGFGDGGGGATYEMLEVGRRLNKGIPGCPKVKMSTSKDYFEKLGAKVVGNKKLPKWVGELYLEYHRGTYTSMARNKRDNRLCENLYITSEKLNSLAMLLGKGYPQEKLNSAWENILLNQFHDILPGTSIKEVYDVTKEEYKNLINDANNFINEGMEFICSNVNLDKKSLIVFNTLGFERKDIAIFTIPLGIKYPMLSDDKGEKILCQCIENGKALAYVEGIPPLGYKTYLIEESLEMNLEKIKLTKESAENDYFKILFDGSGQIKSFVHKENGRELLKAGAIGNELQAFEDRPMNFDNWDIDIFYKEKMWLVDDVQKIEVIENGPLRATLQIERKFMDSKIVQKIYVYKNIGRVDFNTFVDWKQSQILLKVAFPIDINAKKATYEIQYGNIERPTHNNTSWDVAMFEVCAQKWADLSDGGFGVSLLNNCKYGHDIKENIMKLTLIKSGIEPNLTTDQEEHFFTYSIYPHSGDWKEANTVNMAYNLNVPLYTKIEDAHKGKLPSSISIVKVDKENVMIEVVKKAEDSEELVIRMYEYQNKRSYVTLEFFRDIDNIVECNLMERNLEQIKFEKNKISFEIKPYEIKSFKVRLKNN